MTYIMYVIWSNLLPCHYSTYNPWMVIAHYNREETVSAIVTSIFIPNIIFVISIGVLVYWYNHRISQNI